MDCFNMRYLYQGDTNAEAFEITPCRHFSNISELVNYLCAVRRLLFLLPLLAIEGFSDSP